MLNLIRDPWLRLIRRDPQGHTFIENGRWCDITRDFRTCPVVDLQSARPDLRGALYTLGIGLLQTACAPKSDIEWRAWLKEPPSPETLQALLEPLAPYFELSSAGPAFAQALELAEDRDEPISISQLLIEQPATDTIKKNRDFFVKRGNADQFCPPCATAALYAMQAFAPSGGRGHMTSMRGGGPLSTIPLAGTLWDTLWLSTETKPDFETKSKWKGGDSPRDWFPWLETTKHKPEKGERWLPDMLHPLHCYWAMPRRLRLFPAEDGTFCDVCQQACQNSYRFFASRPFGYAFGEGWRHPLTPYYYLKPTELLPVKGPQTGVSFNQWYGFAAAPYDQSASGKPGERVPASVVQRYRKEGRNLQHYRPSQSRLAPRLWAFGYAMDNKKAVFWVDQLMPLLCARNPEDASAWLNRVGPSIRGLVESADQVKRTLIQQFKAGFFRHAKGQKADFSSVEQTFWDACDQEFQQMVEGFAIEEWDAETRIQHSESWLKTLQKQALVLFDALFDARLLNLVNPKPMMDARDALLRFTSPNGKNLRAMLDLPEVEKAPDEAREKKGRKAKARKGTL